jgi:hypothetical protein
VNVFIGAIARGAGTGTREIGAFIAGFTLVGFGGIARAGRGFATTARTGAVVVVFVFAGVVLRTAVFGDFVDDFADEVVLPLAARFFVVAEVAAGFL